MTINILEDSKKKYFLHFGSVRLIGRRSTDRQPGEHAGWQVNWAGWQVGEVACMQADDRQSNGESGKKASRWINRLANRQVERQAAG